MTLNMGPSGVRGPTARKGWGISTVRMSNGRAITIAEARRRVRAMKNGVVKKAALMLRAAAEPLAEQWRDNIAAEGWGPGGSEEGDDELTALFEERGLEYGTEGGSTGRYYNSIAVEVTDDLEVHVGSTIPRPSGRGLRSWSYPEALEYGTSKAEARPTLGPAIEQAGPKMESKSSAVFNALLDGYADGRYRV